MTDTDLGERLTNWRAPDLPKALPVEGRYASLEPLNADAHAAALHDANCADTAIWDYLPYGPFSSLSAYHRWVRDRAAETDPQFYAVMDKDRGKWGGVATLMRMTPEAGSIEVGHINFAPRLQKRRAASETIMLLAARVFALGYRRFEWKCNALNSGSRRAAERFGFSYEGTFRQAAISKGRNRDTAWFAMIDKDWPAINAAYKTWLDPENFDAAGQQIKALSALTRPILVTRDPKGN